MWSQCRRTGVGGMVNMGEAWTSTAPGRPRPARLLVALLGCLFGCGGPQYIPEAGLLPCEGLAREAASAGPAAAAPHPPQGTAPPTSVLDPEAKPRPISL